MRTLEQYIHLRESDEKKGNPEPLNAKVTLGDGNNYEPFVVSDDPNSENYGKNRNLAPVIRAFKKGANWGWSKDEKTGEDKPVKISGKKLYLAGGSTRDHLAGKTPRNIELATNASPDEIYHILKQNDFEYVEDIEKSKKNAFAIRTKDEDGRPFSFDIKVRNDRYELDTFTKTPKGIDGNPEPGTHSDDAAGRDFTINAMFIALTNDNGPNKELCDFYGGMHHLSSGKITTVGNMKDKFNEDPKRIMRFGRMISGYGKPENISDEEKEIISKLSDRLSEIDHKDIMGEFKKGMNKDGCNSRDYISLFDKLGLLNKIFPGKILDTDMPKELSELGDKNMSLAWLLKGNHESDLEDVGLDSDVLRKIIFLIKSLSMGNGVDENSLYDLTNNFAKSGITGRKFKEWGSKVAGLDSGLLDAFVNHSNSPRIKVMVLKDDGTEEVGEEFSDLFDPFTGNPTNQSMVEGRKKALEYQNFMKQF